MLHLKQHPARFRRCVLLTQIHRIASHLTLLLLFQPFVRRIDPRFSGAYGLA